MSAEHSFSTHCLMSSDSLSASRTRCPIPASDMSDAHAFSPVLRGECVVETGAVLRGPPKTVKVTVGYPDGAMTYFCGCWPRGPRFCKVAKFVFKRQKKDSSLQTSSYTSLETVMKVEGMAFKESYRPGKAAVKVSIKQRRGKKVVLYRRLTTFLHELQNREAENFVLYVTETGFKIITKDPVVPVSHLEDSGGEQTDAPETQTSKPLEENFKFKYVNQAKIDYMTSLRNSFKGNKEYVNFTTTPEIVKLPPVIPMQTRTLRSHYKEAAGAREQHSRAPRSVHSHQNTSRKPRTSKNEEQIMCSKKNYADGKTTDKKNKGESETEKVTKKKEEPETLSEVQPVQETGDGNTESTNVKNTPVEEEKTSVLEEYDKNEPEKTESETADVNSVFLEAEKTDEEKKENSEKEEFAENEQEPGKVSEMHLVQESDDEHLEGKEVNTHEGKDTDICEECDAQGSGKEEVHLDNVKNASPEKDSIEKEIKEDTETECGVENDEEEGISSEVQLLQERDDDHSESEEEAKTEETNVEEMQIVPPQQENADKEETQGFENNTEKTDVTDKVNIPSLTKLLSNVIVKNSTRRDKIRKAMHLRKKRERAPRGNVNTTRVPRKNTEKKQYLRKKVLPLCRQKKTVMGKVSSRWRWWSCSTTPVKKTKSRMKVKMELNLRKKTLLRSHYLLKRNKKRSQEKKKTYKKINPESVKSKIDSRNSLASIRDYKPNLDLSVLEAQQPPPGPERVKWARQVASLKARLHSQQIKKAKQ